jgi:hypothetical protein
MFVIAKKKSRNWREKHRLDLEVKNPVKNLLKICRQAFFWIFLLCDFHLRRKTGGNSQKDSLDPDPDQYSTK